ncbi:MAG: phosphoribosylformylglycinamidine synthase [Planctomycetes bacterium]|nr:phosphoribosylformylglycinamidine synthase [Planctomycetota bacterium]
MIHRIERRVREGAGDPVARGILADALDLGIEGLSGVVVSDLFWIEGELSADEVGRARRELFVDPVAEEAVDGVGEQGAGAGGGAPSAHWVTILRKPGVMDPVEGSARRALAELGLTVGGVRAGRQYGLQGSISLDQCKLLVRRLLANPVVDEVHLGRHDLQKLALGRKYVMERAEVPLLDATDADLTRLSKERGLALSIAEMHAIREHFRGQRRNPSDVELETIAQTWSEHCKHKTLTGPIAYKDVVIENLLKHTIFRVTEELDKDWCLSVFQDNAGVIEFDEEYAVCFKVETHNHPSALDPYGGSATGVGGVVRDCLGCGLGARPVLNTDVFCVGPLDFAMERVPEGVLHPRRVLKGLVAGVRDYGNRMGIPTASGAVFSDPRYLANPLVFCGTVGVLPKSRVKKGPRPGDLILLAGGRTGRDGIHGATFSSEGLTPDSEAASGGAVQIGNAITEKKLVDTVLQVAEKGLLSSITDCGAGGLSSAVGEMAAGLGAVVDLDRVPLKYEGLSPTEIWISEAQERMVLAVHPKHLNEAIWIFGREEVDATVIGHFTEDKRLHLRYGGQRLANLDLEFLHHGLPRVRLTAEWDAPAFSEPMVVKRENYGEHLRRILGSVNVCSKEAILRQYDHEVQGGMALKPLVGAANDGPGDAVVLRPVLSSHKGLAVSCGMAPRFGDIDPYAMAASAIDEALRNVIAVGGNLDRVALLDNFCWGNTRRSRQLGGLVRAAQACYDVALAYGAPFISGKDSLNNEFALPAGYAEDWLCDLVPAGVAPGGPGARRPVRGRAGAAAAPAGAGGVAGATGAPGGVGGAAGAAGAAEPWTLAIPPSLLISAICVMPDVTKSVSMDLKRSGSPVYLVGRTKNELGGSHYYGLLGAVGNAVPQVDAVKGRDILEALSIAMERGLVLACHDLCEGGLAVAAAEMAFAGDQGLEMELASVPSAVDAQRDDILLFSESNTRFLVEVSPESQKAFEDLMWSCLSAGEMAPPIVPRPSHMEWALVGWTTDHKRLSIHGLEGKPVVDESLADLKAAWQGGLKL